MTDYLDRESKRVDDFDSRANRPVDEMNTTGYSARMGLTASMRTELDDVITTCQKLKAVGDQVAAAAGAKGAQFSTIAGRSDDLGKKATEVLNADYSTPLNTNTTPIQTGRQTVGPGQVPPLHPGQTGH